MSVQYIAPTPRKKIGKREAARLFLLHNGICCNCGQQITTGAGWFIEHVDALVLGGAETDANRRPAHLKCKAAKDASDAAARAKRDTIITKGWAQTERPKMQGRGFAKSKPQHRATTALEPKFPGDIITRKATL